MGSQVRFGAHKLNRVAVAKAGARVARRHGVDGVTMRSVAAVLGVTPMALYGYVDSSDALRRAAVDSALQLVQSPPCDGTVEARLRSWAHAARRGFRAHPDLAAVCLTDWPELREGCRIMESLLSVAADHTPRGADQVAVANAVFVYVVTRAIAERAVLARGKVRAIPAVEAEPRRFPRLAKVQSQFRAIDTDRHFEIGLEALLDGLLTSKA